MRSGNLPLLWPASSCSQSFPFPFYVEQLFLLIIPASSNYQQSMPQATLITEISRTLRNQLGGPFTFWFACCCRFYFCCTAPHASVSQLAHSPASVASDKTEECDSELQVNQWLLKHWSPGAAEGPSWSAPTPDHRWVLTTPTRSLLPQSFFARVFKLSVFSSFLSSFAKCLKITTIIGVCKVILYFTEKRKRARQRQRWQRVRFIPQDGPWLTM